MTWRVSPVLRICARCVSVVTRVKDLRQPAVAVAKHGRPFVVVMGAEEIWRLKALDAPTPAPAAKRKASTLRRSTAGSG